MPSLKYIPISFVASVAVAVGISECREDLQRDEEIFAEKVRELKSYRKKLRQMEKDNAEFKEKLEGAGRAQQQQQQWQLRSPVRSPPRRRGTTVHRCAVYDIDCTVHHERL